MKYPFLIAFFFGVLFSYAQLKCEKKIVGQVLSLDSGEPLPFATIQLEGLDKGTISDEKGFFKIEGVCEQEIHLIISFVGFKTLIHHHDFYHPQPVIYLAPNELELESVVIEESRSESKISSLAIESKELSTLETLGASAGSIVSELSGVSMLKTGQNVVKPIIHGLHSNRILMIVNGVRHANQAWGREHAPEIDPSQIDQLTLVKGASTVQYGPEALGGVILFNNERPHFDQALNAEMGSGYQTNGRAYSGDLTVQQGFHRFAWKAGVYGTRQGDLKAPDYQLTNTGKEETGYYFSSALHFNQLDIDVYASRFQQELGILRGSVVGNINDLVVAMNSDTPEGTRSFSYAINNPRQEVAHSLYKLKGSLYLGENEVNAQYAFQQNLRKEFDIRRGSNNQLPQVNLELNTHTFDLDWKYQSIGKLNGSIGFQFLYQDNNNIPGTNTIPFIPNFNETSFGFFTIQKLENESHTIEFGLRYDNQTFEARGRDSRNDLYTNNLNFENFTFSLGYVKELTPSLKLHTNIASAWRAPKVGELYSFGKNHNRFEYGIWRFVLTEDGTDINTNNVLDNNSKPVYSERGIKWIGSMELRKPTLEMEVVPYVNYIKNYFFTRPYGLEPNVRGPFPGYIYGQTDGLFLGTDVQAKVNHTDNLFSEIKMAYLYARDVKSDQFFLEIPPFTISYSLTKKWNVFSAGLSAEWTARQWNTPSIIPPEVVISDDPNIDLTRTFDFIPATDGYALIHASGSYQKGRLKALLKIQNLLNQSYRVYTDRIRYFADDVGFNASLAINYKLSK